MERHRQQDPGSLNMIGSSKHFGGGEGSRTLFISSGRGAKSRFRTVFYRTFSTVEALLAKSSRSDSGNPFCGDLKQSTYRRKPANSRHCERTKIRN